MKYRYLGRSGLLVSRLCLGTMTFGNAQWGCDQETSSAIVNSFVAAGIGYLLYRGMVRINLGTFFAWTGVFLIIVAAGILAYGVHDLQEAAILPGPFSGHPITPTDLRTGEVLVGITDGPYWMAAYPFGWAFDLSGSMDPSGLLATFLKGTVGFTPQMTWLEVTFWAIYLVEVMPRFLIQVHRNRVARKARLAAAAVAAAAPVSVPADAAAAPATNGSHRPNLADSVPLGDPGLRRDDHAADLATDERTH